MREKKGAVFPMGKKSRLGVGTQKAAGGWSDVVPKCRLVLGAKVAPRHIKKIPIPTLMGVG